MCRIDELSIKMVGKYPSIRPHENFSNCFCFRPFSHGSKAHSWRSTILVGDGDQCVHNVHATDTTANVYDMRNIGRQPVRPFDVVRDHSIRGDARIITNDAMVSYGKPHNQILHMEYFHQPIDTGGHITNVFRVPFSASVPARRGARHLRGACRTAAIHPTAMDRYANAGCAGNWHCFVAAHGCRLFRPNAVARRPTVECSQGMQCIQHFTIPNTDTTLLNHFRPSIGAKTRILWNQKRRPFTDWFGTSVYYSDWYCVHRTAEGKVV